MGFGYIFFAVLFSLLGASYGNSCVNDFDCQETLGLRNTVCLNNTCECHEDFYFEVKTGHCALSHQRLHGPCSENSDCTKYFENSICKFGRCSCERGYEHTLPDLQSCVQAIGVPCQTVNDCTRRPREILCHPETKTCQCPKGTFYQTPNGWTNSQCVELDTKDPGVGFGYYACGVDAHCEAYRFNSYCKLQLSDEHRGYCDCKAGTIKSKIQNMCVKIEEVKCSSNDACRVHDDNAHCVDGKCSCAENFYLHTKYHRCEEIPRTLKTGICEDQSHCNFYNSECRRRISTLDSFCQCIEDHVSLVDNSCVYAAGQTCEKTTDCSKYLSSMICTEDRICACPEGYYFQQEYNTCGLLPKRLHSDRCDRDWQCETFDRNARCFKQETSGMCYCKEGYVEIDVDNQYSKCELPFGTCETSADCKEPNQRCVTNRDGTLKYCDCAMNYGIEKISSTKYECQHTILKRCNYRNRSWDYCANHMKYTYCQGLSFPVEECMCDVVNGYYYDSDNMVCRYLGK